jgi:uncharacterized membrane protein YdjX (TVP38/TMEM64 family)
MKEYRFAVKDFVGERYLVSVAAYVLCYTAVAGASIPGAAILTMLGGFAFSTIPAAVYTNMGATAGAVIIFILTRYLIGGRLQSRFRDKLEKFNREIEKNGPNYLLTLRFIPLFPFWMINMLSGLTKIPLVTFAWTTSLGIIPGSLVYAFIGSRLNYINRPEDVLTGSVLAAFFLLALLSVLPVAFSKLKLRQDKSR